MPVSDQHPEYTSSSPAWQLDRDCVKGSEAIKARGTTYLPKPNPDDTSKENGQRYNDYRARANYVNFTGSTKDGMLGMVFRKPMDVDLSPELEYMLADFTGGGLTLDQMARGLIGDLLETGRFGVLVDYPGAAPGLTKDQEKALNLRANALGYRAEDVINWRTEMIGGVKMLTMVVLREPKQEISDDGFSFEEKIWHRVLSLAGVDDKRIYIQNVYNENDELVEQEDGDGNPMPGRDIIPLKADGSTWNNIPFIFVGAQNNDETVDKAPLYDIAEVNIAHYRNSADWEESSYMVGQPTGWAAGLNQSWIDTVLKDGILLGSRAFLLLPEGGSAGLIQANPNQMPETGMNAKESQMIKLGARIIEDSQGQETAEAAKIRFAGQNSKLGTIVGNVEAALRVVIGWAAEFMGAPEDVELEINKQFYDKKVDPQLITAGIMLLDRGVIAKADLQDELRRGGMIAEDRTNEDIDSEAEEGVLDL